MIGTIIGALVGGLFIGVLARLVMPGKQKIGVIMTMFLGTVGGLAGSWLVYALGYHNHHGFKWIPFLVGIVIAVILISAYMRFTVRGRKASERSQR